MFAGDFVSHTVICLWNQAFTLVIHFSLVPFEVSKHPGRQNMIWPVLSVKKNSLFLFLKLKLLITVVFRQKCPQGPGCVLFLVAVHVHVHRALSRAGTQTLRLLSELALGIAVPQDWALPGAQVWAQPAPRCLLQHPSSCWKRSWIYLEELQPLQCRRALRWTVVGVRNVCDWFQILLKLWNIKEILSPPPTFYK